MSYRAVEQYGQVIDVLLSEQRDTPAARRFFTRTLRHGPGPGGRLLARDPLLRRAVSTVDGARQHRVDGTTGVPSTADEESACPP